MSLFRKAFLLCVKGDTDAACVVSCYQSCGFNKVSVCVIPICDMEDACTNSKTRLWCAVPYRLLIGVVDKENWFHISCRPLYGCCLYFRMVFWLDSVKRTSAFCNLDNKWY